MRPTTLCVAIVMTLAIAPIANVLAQHVSPHQAIPSVASVMPTRTTALFPDAQAGSLKIVLEKTRLFDVQHAFGGTIQHEGDAGGSSEWLCYAGPDAHGAPAVFWFLSGEMGGAEESILSLAQQPNPDGKVPDGCSAAPNDLKTIDVGVPAVGATLRDVISHFGPAKPDANGNFHYAASYPSSSLKDFTVTQTLVYTAKQNAITGVAITQVTSD